MRKSGKSKSNRYFRIFFYAIPLKLDEYHNYKPDYSPSFSSSKLCIHIIDIPDWVFLKHIRHIDIIHSKLQLQHPNFKIDKQLHPYYQSVKNQQIIDLKKSISAHKAQITKIQNWMNQYKTKRYAELFWDPSTDNNWQQALFKLELQKSKLYSKESQLTEIIPDQELTIQS